MLLLPRKDSGEPKWDVKVTSKGQVTLPKKARDIMMVREGDHLEAVIHDDSMVLRRRDEIPEGEKVRANALRNLRDLGIDPGVPHPELSPQSVRKRMPKLPTSLADRVRAQRESREEP
jgi:AbrB family looped-hinge helix DNA binding protein